MILSSLSAPAALLPFASHGCFSLSSLSAPAPLLPVASRGCFPLSSLLAPAPLLPVAASPCPRLRPRLFCARFFFFQHYPFKFPLVYLGSMPAKFFFSSIVSFLHTRRRSLIKVALVEQKRYIYMNLERVLTLRVLQTLFRPFTCENVVRPTLFDVLAPPPAGFSECQPGKQFQVYNDTWDAKKARKWRALRKKNRNTHSNADTVPRNPNPQKMKCPEISGQQMQTPIKEYSTVNLVLQLFSYHFHFCVFLALSHDDVRIPFILIQAPAHPCLISFACAVEGVTVLESGLRVVIPNFPRPFAQTGPLPWPGPLPQLGLFLGHGPSRSKVASNG